MRTNKGLRSGAAALALLGAALAEGGQALADQVIADDLIVQGSLCVGFDCVNNENFGFDTIRLKENNLRIHFDDTSTAAGFPANDWRIVINDSASGGNNYFGIDDATANRRVFEIRAGAPTNALFVDQTGNVGLRTANPVLPLHINRGNTPGMRLEQDNSQGFSPQTWDIAGNEANFFIRDVTNGSLMPFRIRPGAPTSSIDIAASGNVGFGTAGPQASLHIRREDPRIRLSNTTNDHEWEIAAGESLTMRHIGTGQTVFNISSGGSTAVGPQSAAAGANSAAFGPGAQASADFSAAFGPGSTAGGTNSAAFGRGSSAAGRNSVAIGVGTSAGHDAVVIGRGSSATHTNSIVLGFNSVSTGRNTVSVGAPDAERRITNVAPGTSPTDAVNLAQLQAAVGVNSTFVESSLMAPHSGPRAAQVSHPDGVGLGPEAKGTGEAATAVGTRAEATGDEATALGADSRASGERATAVGSHARAAHANSAAVGHGAQTMRAGQMVLGTGANTYTMPGIASPASRAVQSGPLEVVTTDRAGNLASDGGEIFRRLGDVREESRQGVAAAMAMTSAPMPSTAGRTSWTANLATFRGEAGFGASLAHRFDTAMPLALTAGYAYGGGDSHGARVGLAGEF